MKVKQVIQFAAISSALIWAPFNFATTTSTTTDTVKNTDAAKANTDTSNKMRTIKKPNDSKITADIKSKLTTDKLTSGLTIQAKTTNGVVTLTGNVNTDAEANRAVEIAQSTPGVTDTNTNDLKVKASNQPMTDSFITAKVKGSFVREKLFGEKDISVTGIQVETTNGIVYLSGIVDTPTQVTNAVKIAKSVDGVKGVQSKLEVKPKA